MSYIQMAAAIPLMDDPLMDDPTATADWALTDWDPGMTAVLADLARPLQVLDKPTVEISDIQVRASSPSVDMEEDKMDSADPLTDVFDAFIDDSFQDVLASCGDDATMLPLYPFHCGADTSDDDDAMMAGDADDQQAQGELDKLRDTMQSLEQVFFSRIQGQPSDQVNVARAKLVRALERGQRVSCGLAMENHKLRAATSSHVQQCEGVLRDLEMLLASPSTLQTISAALEQDAGKHAIAEARQLVQRERKSDTKTESAVDMMQWALSSSIDASTNTLLVSAKKEFRREQCHDMAGKTWQHMTQASALQAAMTRLGRPMTLHVLQQLSEHEQIVVYDAAECSGETCSIRRCVALVFRESSPTGMVMGVCSLPPSLWESELPQLPMIQYVQQGALWIRFSPSATDSAALAVAVQNAFESASPSDAHTHQIRLMQAILLWEAMATTGMPLVMLS